MPLRVVGKMRKTKLDKKAAPSQVQEQLLRVVVGVREETALDTGATEGHRQEDDGGEEGVHKVNGPDHKLVEVAEGVGGLIVRAGEVDDVEALEGGKAVVELAVLAHEAVGEGEDDAREDTEVDKQGCQVLVGHTATAVVGEGR